MIVIMKPSASEEAIKKATNFIESKGFQVHLLEGNEATTIDVVSDKTKLAGSNTEISEGMNKMVIVTESYKLVNKKFHPGDSVTPVGNTHIGPGDLTIMAGPCAAESREQPMGTALAVRRVGATFLRSSTYRPGISPYSFQGLEGEGPKCMKEVHEVTKLNVIHEMTSQRAIKAAAKYVDMPQVGARNVQNFELLEEAGKSGVPVLSRRGLAATINEWLNTAEYIVSEGNPSIVLCERGIRTFETTIRNTLDINTVPVLKTKSYLPVIMDPSHATDIWIYAEPLVKCAVAVGADDLMIEVHPCPEHALSSGLQSLTFKQSDALTKKLVSFAKLAGRSSKEWQIPSLVLSGLD